MRWAPLILAIVPFLAGEASAYLECPVYPPYVDTATTKKGCFYEGEKYTKGKQIYFDCVKYTCMAKGKGKKAKYYWEEEDNGMCCTYDGMHYPQGCTAYTEHYGPCVALDYVCEHDMITEQVGLKPVLNQTCCSVDDMALDIWQRRDWPAKCSSVECVLGEDGTPTVIYYSVKQGCDCCEYPYAEDGMLANGEEAFDPMGYRVKCCEGVLSYIFPWSPNMTGPEITGPSTYYGSSSGGSTDTTEWSTASTEWSTDSTQWGGWSSWSTQWASDAPVGDEENADAPEDEEDDSSPQDEK